MFAARAILESEILYGADARRAPRGVYTLDREGARVGFSRGAAKFSMPLDAVVMHVFEGRLRLLEGKLI